mgnify:CR=1 FL=1
MDSYKKQSVIYKMNVYLQILKHLKLKKQTCYKNIYIII